MKGGSKDPLRAFLRSSGNHWKHQQRLAHLSSVKTLTSTAGSTVSEHTKVFLMLQTVLTWIQTAHQRRHCFRTRQIQTTRVKMNNLSAQSFGDLRCVSWTSHYNVRVTTNLLIGGFKAAMNDPPSVCCEQLLTVKTIRLTSDIPCLRFRWWLLLCVLKCFWVKVLSSYISALKFNHECWKSVICSFLTCSLVPCCLA